jgi:UDP-glucose 4-epimerase
MTWAGRRVLVTGGASFIGSHLVEALVRLGARIRVADDLSSGRPGHLDAVRDDVDLQVGDLRHWDFATRASAGCEVVFHLAANHGGRGYIATHPADCAGNMALDGIVFETALRNGVERIAFASSACVYPTSLQQGERIPLTEDTVSFERPGGACADEEYGWAKLMGELALRALHRQHGLATAAVRISTAYGPRASESHALVALVAKAAIRQDPFEIWGDGRQTRGFTYVDDVVRALLLAAEHLSDGSAVNAGVSDFIPLDRAAEAVFEAIGWRPSEIRHRPDQPVGVRHRAVDGSLAKRLTGWEPRWSFERGVAATVAWFLANRDVASLGEELEGRLLAR